MTDNNTVKNNNETVMATSPASAASFAVYVAGTPQWQSFLFSSVAPTIAAPFTNPFAVAKTQLQVQKTTGPNRRFQGMTDFFRHAAASKDAAAVKTLQRGLIPVMTREASKNLFRIGLYQPLLKQIHHEEGPAPVWKRMVAGAASGAVGAVVCNPFEIIRIKVQALELGSASTNGMTSRVLKEEGVTGFYKATGASVALGMVCTAVNLTSYTILRERALEHVNEGPTVDMACALASGFCAALAMNPIDVTRTRIMTQPSPPIYRNAFHAAAQILRTEGPRAFFKGFVPSFLRIGPHFVITFMLLEQMRRLAHSYRESNARDEFLLRVFRDIDDDRSGEIDESELVAAIQAADPFGNKQESGVLAKHIFEVADEDKSGSIDQNEFVSAARESKLDKLLRGHQLLVMFRNYDNNGDGEIDEEELFDALKKSRPDFFKKVSDEELHHDVHRIIEDLDRDGDGTINYSEFLLAFDRVNELVEQRLVKEMFQSSGVAVGE